MKANEISKKLDELIPDFQKLMYDSELLAAQTANSILLGRVFSRGAKDINGSDLKPYSEGYAKKRERAGRQTKKKDLIFTGALFESVQVGTKDNRPAMGFLNEGNATIGSYQEEQNNTKIFQLSDQEREVVKKEVSDFVLNGIKEIVAKWS